MKLQMQRLSKDISKYIWYVLEVVAGGVLLLFLSFSFFVIANPLPSAKPYSQLLLDTQGQVVHAFLSSDEKWRFALEPGDVDERFEKALLYKEDKYFYSHPGVNPVAVCRAAFKNTISGRRTSGASTITMQLARLLEPKQRSFSNKLFEMYRAFQLEYFFSKKQILYKYLELAPYGGNIEGLKAATMFYYGQLPNHISPAQIAALVAIPNRPNSLTPGRDMEELRASRNHWIRNFSNAEIFSTSETDLALSEPLTGRRLPAPVGAPHLSRRVHASTQKPIVRLALDMHTQKVCEKLVADQVKKLKRYDIHNAAAMVVENKTGKVLAYVGSADFNDPADGGQNDGILALRSPGSTLKPLLYGLAIEQGKTTPNTIIADVPYDVSGYAPENYSGKYHGAVTAEYALTQSLNIPMVKLLENVGTDLFLDCAIDAGLSSLGKQRKNLGMSVILGGCGISLQELVIMYSSIANGGQRTALQFTEANKVTEKKHFLSAESCFLITEALQKLTRPDLPQNWQYGKDMSKIAWKTGTSYGRRDAWSIGYTEKYTVGVWVGNFSGRGVPELVGAEMAAPLLFNIFSNLPHETVESKPFPKNLSYRLVCSLSGNVPGSLCSHTRVDAFLPGISSNKKCTIETLVRVNADSTRSYCLNCSPPSGYREIVYDNYPVDLAAFYTHTKSPAERTIPPHNPECSRIFEENGPVITSPVDGLTYYLNPSDSTAVKFTALTSGGVAQTFWFVDNHPVEKTAVAEEVFVFLPEGKHTITCADDRGRTSRISINIVYVLF